MRWRQHFGIAVARLLVVVVGESGILFRDW
jgi:hypothetical protein